MLQFCVVISVLADSSHIVGLFRNCLQGTIDIIGASYGRGHDGVVCPHVATSDQECHAENSVDILNAACEGQVACQVSSPSCGRSRFAAHHSRMVSSVSPTQEWPGETKHCAFCLQVVASNAVFGDPCGGTYKYLTVNYQCV